MAKGYLCWFRCRICMWICGRIWYVNV